MQTRAKSGIHKPNVFVTNTKLLSFEPKIVAQALQDPKWKEAMIDEYNALLLHHTWHLVPYNSSMNLLCTKWLFRNKFDTNGNLIRQKARFVAKGFNQTPGKDFTKTFSSVVKSSTIKVMFSLLVSYGWDI